MRGSLLPQLLPVALTTALFGALPASALLLDDTPSITIKSVTVRSQDEVGGDDVYLKIYRVRGSRRELLRETKPVTLRSGQSHDINIGDLSFGNDDSARIVIEVWDADSGLRGGDDLLQSISYAPDGKLLPSFLAGQPNWGSIEAEVCDRQCHFRNFQETQAALSRKRANTYLISIDCSHDIIKNEGTADQLTFRFWAGNQLINTLSSSRLTNAACAGQSQTITVKTPDNLTHLTIATSGRDAFFVDRLSVTKNGRALLTSERDNYDGYCLSQDPSDATRTWKGYVAACEPELKFTW